ncbi:MAG: hypothetical protein ACOVQG_07745 [Crocinitomicaceae bacterium]
MKRLKNRISVFLMLTFGTSFSQENGSLDAAISSQGFKFIESSISNSGNFYAALFSDSKTLLVAKNEIGDFPVFEKIEFQNGEGAFRPVGYPKDQYIYYTFFDVSSIIPSEVRIHPKSSIHQKRRKPNRNIRLNGFLNGDPLITSTSNSFQTQLALANSNNYYVDRSPMNISKYEFRYSNQPSFVFAQDDYVVCFSQGAERVSLLNLSGDVLTSNDIVTIKPLISSSKGRTILFDKAIGKFYMVVESNFSYNFYLIDIKTGKTNYLFKTETVWANPNWELNNGVLNYEKTLENKKVRLSRNMNE